MTYYYDYNRKTVCTRKVIKAVYGADYYEAPNERLAEIHVFPIGPSPEPPENRKISPLQTPEEEQNGGPIYEVIDGQAIRKYTYVPIDPLIDNYKKLWVDLSPSMFLARVWTIASAVLDQSTIATRLLSELTLGRIGQKVDESALSDYVRNFYPQATAEEQNEADFIFYDCNLLYVVHDPTDPPFAAVGSYVYEENPGPKDGFRPTYFFNLSQAAGLITITVSGDVIVPSSSSFSYSAVDIDPTLPMADFLAAVVAGLGTHPEIAFFVGRDGTCLGIVGQTGYELDNVVVSIT